MNRHIIHQYATIIEALRRLNELSGDVMTLIVTDESNRMLGTVTDGDIRRGLLNGVTPADLIDRVIHTGFMAIHTGQKPLERINTLRQARKKGIALLPELRPDGTINRLINLNRTDTLLPLTAILMAGGQGERLRPLTLTTPKPLLEIDGRPIIDYNIERLARAVIIDV